MIFQVIEAVHVVFKGELFWHSANPATENVKSYLEVSGTRGRMCCTEDLLRTSQGNYLSVGLFALSPMTAHKGVKKSLQ